MSKKISEEMADRLLDAEGYNRDSSGRKIRKDNWRSAGLLEPEEDELEKARDAWKALANCLVHFCDQRIYGELQKMGETYEAAITRLKASAYNDEAMIEFARMIDDTDDFSDHELERMLERFKLAQHRVGKGAE